MSKIKYNAQVIYKFLTNINNNFIQKTFINKGCKTADSNTIEIIANFNN